MFIAAMIAVDMMVANSGGGGRSRADCRSRHEDGSGAEAQATVGCDLIVLFRLLKPNPTMRHSVSSHERPCNSDTG
jgi:hypothetical protein